jgi:exodeoxyribonuclease VII large subunit
MEHLPLFDPPVRKEPKVISVAQLTAQIQGSLESQFQSVWVRGEIAEVSRPQSGHIYFTLKDEQAQIRAVLWRSAAQRIKFKLADGQQVVCHGAIDVYPARGSYQLVVQQIEPQGLGALQLAFKQLQERLAAEGLFDKVHKRSLPLLPRRVGFVTSPTGAAIHDFLQVARRRCCGVNVLVIPARVQGEGSAEEIARGIALANRLRPRLDVLVVGRGGGSLEDLWSFNEEVVVRAIFASEVPVVSAVGHEVDVTLADLVADVRALTPSEAAERVIPSAEELNATLRQLQRRLANNLRGRAAAARKHLDQLARSRVLRNPRVLLLDLSRRLDELELRARRATERRLQVGNDRLASLAAHLESLSPLGVLARGYSVTTKTDTGHVVRSVEAVALGDRLSTRVSDGVITSRVER